MRFGLFFFITCFAACASTRAPESTPQADGIVNLGNPEVMESWQNVFLNAFLKDSRLIEGCGLFTDGGWGFGEQIMVYSNDDGGLVRYTPRNAFKTDAKITENRMGLKAINAFFEDVNKAHDLKNLDEKLFDNARYEMICATRKDKKIEVIQRIYMNFKSGTNQRYADLVARFKGLLPAAKK